MISQKLDAAREAFKKRDVEEMRRVHQKQAPEFHKVGQGRYIKSVVYGGLDGIITTFAIVAGVAGASLSGGVVLILGFANLVADGLSMGIGDYLSTQSENEYNKAERARETWEVDHYPQGEKEELVDIYVAKGLAEEDARTMVDIMAKNRKAWVDIMMVEELGIIESDESPIRNAIATFCSFAIFGFVPLIAYVLSLFIPAVRPHAFVVACALTGVTLFTLGAVKARITGRRWFLSGFEVFVVGGLAAVAAYVIGFLLSGLV